MCYRQLGNWRTCWNRLASESVLFVAAVAVEEPVAVISAGPGPDSGQVKQQPGPGLVEARQRPAPWTLLATRLCFSRFRCVSTRFVAWHLGPGS